MGGRTRPATVATVIGIAVATVGLAVAAFAAATGPGVSAHLVSITPEPGAVLFGSPGNVDLALSGVVDATQSHITVSDSDGVVVNRGQLRELDPQTLRQEIDAALTGDFTIAYHVSLIDGRDVVGSTNFSVNTGAAPDAVSQEAHGHGVDPIGATLLVINGLVLGGVLIMLRIRPAP